jgi:hypothetical protein
MNACNLVSDSEADPLGRHMHAANIGRHRFVSFVSSQCNHPRARYTTWVYGELLFVGTCAMQRVTGGLARSHMVR